MTLELSGAEQLLLPGERSCGEGQPRLPCGAGGISVSHSLFGSETAGESPNPCGSSLDKGGGEAALQHAWKSVGFGDLAWLGRTVRASLDRKAKK